MNPSPTTPLRVDPFIRSFAALFLLTLSSNFPAFAFSFLGGEEASEQPQPTSNALAILVLPSGEKEPEDAAWLAALQQHPNLRLTVALSRRDLGRLNPVRKTLMELKRAGRLEPAVRVANDPPLPLIYDMEMSRIYLRKLAPLPREKVAWPEDMAIPIVKEKLQFKEFWGFSPKGFVPGGGALSTPIADFLMKQKFSWSVASFPDAEWSDDEILAMETEGKEPFQIMKAHGLSKPFYQDAKEFNPSGSCCAPSQPYVQKLLHELGTERKLAPVIVFDEARAKVSLEDFLQEFASQTSTSSSTGEEKGPIRMMLCSEIKESILTDRQTASLQIWSYSWSWLRGLGTPSGPGLVAWIGDSQKNYAWDLLAQTRSEIEKYKDSGSADMVRLDNAMEELYQAEAGDFFEWFGSGLNDIEKDPAVAQIRNQKQILFKATLENVYRHLNLPVPNSLRRSSFASARSAALKTSRPKMADALPDGAKASGQEILKSTETLPPKPAPRGKKLVFEWEDRNELQPGSPEPSIKKFSVAVSSVSGRETVFFSILFKGSLGPKNAADVYIDINHRAGAGNTSLLQGRNATVIDADAWELVLTNRWIPARGWTGSLYRSLSLNPALFTAAIQYRTTSNPKTTTFEIRIPKSLVGEDPGKWGFLACLVGPSGEIVDFLSSSQDKENLIAASKDRTVTLPIIREEGMVQEKN